MFDFPFDWLAIGGAISAFIFARKALNQVRMLRVRLDLFEAATRASATLPPIPTPWLDQMPQATPAVEAAETGVNEDLPPPIQPSPAPPPIPDIAPPPSAPEAGPGFEERLGTRWV